ncbi:MAG: hypothetical protein AB3N14_02455 [Flavobacteriaceae bacterium]
MKQILHYLSFWLLLFLAIYFFIYIFPFPLDWLPFQIGKGISELISEFWQWLVLFVAEDLIGYSESIATRNNGSGDGTYHFFKVVVQAILAIVLSIIWLLLDKKMVFYNKIRSFITVYVRYYLGFTLLSYGLAKVFPNQFWEPQLTDLLKPFGDISPMGLLWKFMGYSVSYIIFTGILEVLAGALLFFRNTAKLGALIAFGILLNIFVLNMSYDVPVKLYSFHLLILSILILIPYLRGLVNFFILNRSADSYKSKPYFNKTLHNRFGYFIKGILILFIASTMISNNYENQWKFGRKAPLPILYGIYEVESFVKNNDTVPPIVSHNTRWKRLVIDRYNANVTKMNDEVFYVGKEIDTVNEYIELKSFKDASNYRFKYHLKNQTLVLTGTKDYDSLEITFKVRNKSDFYLMKRGFHWINEFPNNR